MDIDSKNKAFYEIINHYGIDEQQRMFSEEASELTVALSKLHRYENIVPIDYEVYKLHRQSCNDDTYSHYEKLINNVIEEIVDTQIMLDQLLYIYAANKEKDINNLYDYKINRALERVNFEKDYMKNSSDFNKY